MPIRQRLPVPSCPQAPGVLCPGSPQTQLGGVASSASSLAEGGTGCHYFTLKCQEKEARDDKISETGQEGSTPYGTEDI